MCQVGASTQLFTLTSHSAAFQIIFKHPLNAELSANQQGGRLHVRGFSLAGLKIAANALHAT